MRGRQDKRAAVWRSVTLKDPEAAVLAATSDDNTAASPDRTTDNDWLSGCVVNWRAAEGLEIRRGWRQLVDEVEIQLVLSTAVF
mmetsp:Transcript_11683/g.27220  ORF Transcript_11683/g.27220 Transcript_11683/m.27220 type:complete len:84 (-) Transcript_11683:421-672(-)